MKFSYNWICEYLNGMKPSAKEMADLLMFHSFEVDSIEKKDDDWMMDIKVLPNRICDCSCHLGMAREVAAVKRWKMGLMSSTYVETAKPKTNDLLEVKIENNQDCARYRALMMIDVEVKESPSWLKKKLEVCGLKPINNIVDATNYVMLETGQPLHAFDYDKLNAIGSGKKLIVVRRAKKNEVIQTLDKEQTPYTLDKETLVISDQKAAIAIAGIKGGANTGIDQNTTKIVIEAANFYGPLIRRASQKLKLKTDASIRFENWIDSGIIDLAHDRVAQLIQQVAGGKALAKPIDIYPNKGRGSRSINLSIAKVNRLLGRDIPEKEVLGALGALGFSTEKIKGGIKVQNIEARIDLKLPEDIIEEIGRVLGYENIEAKVPDIKLALPPYDHHRLVERQIKDIMATAGLSEAHSYSFCGHEDQNIFGWNSENLVTLNNPISQAYSYLRPSLLPNLLKIAKHNLKFNEQVQFFEIGHNFCFYKTVMEKKVLAGLLAGQGSDEAQYFRAKGHLELISGKLSPRTRFTATNFKDEAGLIWHPRNSALVSVGDKYCGIIGLIHPAILDKLNLKTSVAAWELDLGVLAEFWSSQSFQPIAVHPSVERDISVWVPQEVTADDFIEAVQKIILSQQEDQILTRAEIIGSDDEIAKSARKRNLVARIFFQSNMRSLSADDINPKMHHLCQELEKISGWSVRK